MRTITAFILLTLLSTSAWAQSPRSRVGKRAAGHSNAPTSFASAEPAAFDSDDPFYDSFASMVRNANPSDQFYCSCLTNDPFGPVVNKGSLDVNSGAEYMLTSCARHEGKSERVPSGIVLLSICTPRIQKPSFVPSGYGNPAPGSVFEGYYAPTKTPAPSAPAPKPTPSYVPPRSTSTPSGGQRTSHDHSGGHWEKVPHGHRWVYNDGCWGTNTAEDGHGPGERGAGDRGGKLPLPLPE